MSACYLWGVFLATAVLILIFTFSYLFLMTKRHKKRREKDRCIIDKYPKLPDSLIVLYNSVLDRRHSSITNFLIFQTTTKVFGFTGVLYSVYAFGLGFYDVPKKLSVLVSFVSLISVVIALYLSPERRISKYIVAWRKYDKMATDMIGKFPFYDGKPGNCHLILKEVADISKEISDIESSIVSDES